ncbi:MAG: PEP-CTERM sorting domain-containing protein [Paludisphaera borealis]|uniref:PEP-CTERM sorting domain-containing protein n=1 Tax=Paludisphaera borealis TaxID=1387353 RepID=UPI0028403C4D|nr:PEP-CTERM sorting domain-containing protein [Paludisphaera borealis]MDR3618836.1 PEP-CTERM sorting domain-containing protein [Paludisphaera borealis]
MAILSFSPRVDAALVFFSGLDVGAKSTDPRPNSDAAAASFNSAAALLGSTTLVDFESAPLGSFTNLTIAPGVSMNGQDINGFPQTISDAPYSSDPNLPENLTGYNTTPGGSKFVQLVGGSLTFTFAQGIQAFGAYLTGVELDGETVTFNDGTSQTIAIPNEGLMVGGSQFLGFADAGRSILSITLTVQANDTGDVLGLDDARWVTAGAAPAVPEPSALSLIAIGLATAAAASRRLRKPAA